MGNDIKLAILEAQRSMRAWREEQIARFGFLPYGIAISPATEQLWKSAAKETVNPWDLLTAMPVLIDYSLPTGAVQMLDEETWKRRRREIEGLPPEPPRPEPPYKIGQVVRVRPAAPRPDLAGRSGIIREIKDSLIDVPNGYWLLMLEVDRPDIWYGVPATWLEEDADATDSQ